MSIRPTILGVHGENLKHKMNWNFRKNRFGNPAILGRMGYKQDRVERRRLFALAALFAIILFLPIVVSHSFMKMWHEISWRNPIDIAMLEWTGAFLNIFLFLLLLEHSRQTGKMVFVFMSCAFLWMGILNFIYALSQPGSEIAIWIKALAMLVGSGWFVLCIAARETEETDFTGALVRCVFPALFFSLFVGWGVNAVKEILPAMLTPDGYLTMFGAIFFLSPGILFFTAGISWLHDYMKDHKGEYLVIAVIIFIYGQMTIVIRYAQSWGVLWWGWHITLVVAVFLVSLYLLVRCVQRSTIWRLLLSLGFAFGLTVVIASGIIQSYSEKRGYKAMQKFLFDRQVQAVLKDGAGISFAVQSLENIQRHMKSFLSGREGLPESIIGEELEKFLREVETNQPNSLLEAGFYEKNNDVFMPVKKNFHDERWNRLMRNNMWEDIRRSYASRPVFGKFYFDNSRKLWVTMVAIRYKDEKFEGYFYHIIDVSGLKNKGLLGRKLEYTDQYEGRIILNINTGRVVVTHLPQSYISACDQHVAHEKLPLISKLAADVLDISEKGKAFSVSMMGHNYFVCGHLIPTTQLVVIDIFDSEFLLAAGRGSNSRYIFAAVGMVALLAGFIILLLFLNYQLAKPIRAILYATEKLKSGDFSVQINSKKANELGVVSRAFDHMVLQLKGLYEELAHTIDDRTKTLEALKKANQAKSIFFANISHELRTPLHGILSFSRLGIDLKKTEDSEKSEKIVKYFKNINESGERLMKMIDEILELAKLESGHIEFKFLPANLFFIVNQVYEELRAVFVEKKISFVCNKPDYNPIVEADMEMISRVVRNLLGNALKFSEPNKEIRVEFGKEDEAVSVTVLDQGPGIPEEERDNIFGKFVQMQKGRGGVGLGLAISKEIISAHGGKIYVSNRVEGGSAFSFTVPIKPLKRCRPPTPVTAE